ncbi:MAG: putative LytR family transcriptional protein [Chloroflexota bacterium]|jgi:LCP family protein required for cell wall assembly|nr:putative LytR family transcriptional protein [Chloroflexota bacterium]
MAPPFFRTEENHDPLTTRSHARRTPQATPWRPDDPARRSPSIAVFLSFLWPGLGQGYAGRPRAAALFALPVVVVALIALLLVLDGVGRLASLVLEPATAFAIMFIVLLLGLWRVVSMGDAMNGLLGEDPGIRRRAVTVFALLTVIVIVTHAWLGYLTWSVYDAGQRVFAAEEPEVRPSLAPGVTPAPMDDFGSKPFATPATQSSRVNMLLVGVDSSENRNTALTDTLMVVSVDPDTGKIAMVSFPRDLADFTLSNGEVYTSKINSLMTHARTNPDEFPEGPLHTLATELGHILGVPIQYYTAVDLDGFRKVIDLVGGVTIDNKRQINDPTYDWPDGRKGFRLSPGRHHLDGVTALAFVRTRKGVGDTDFDRSRRQQQVLLALRSQLAKPENITRIPDITQAAGNALRTNFPTERVAEFIGLAETLADSDVTGVVLGPPYALKATGPGVLDYRLRFDEKRLARKSVELFGDDSRYAAAAP